jgi:hypothetical protein
MFQADFYRRETSRRKLERRDIDQAKADAQASVVVLRPGSNLDERKPYTACGRCRRDPSNSNSSPDRHHEKQDTEAKASYWNKSSRKQAPAPVPRCMPELEKSCKEAYQQVLARFFTAPQGFRAKQNSWDALVTGSVIRNVLRGWDTCHARRLTLVVQEGYQSEVDAFLTSEGYRVNEEQAVKDISEYSRHDNLTVALIHAEEPPIHYIINLGFSASMNFATWSGLYSLWWNETFHNKRAYPFYPFEKEPNDNPALKKELQSEGIAIRTGKLTTSELVEMTKLRSVGDEGTWKILLDPLDPPEETKTTVPDYVIEVTSFQFRLGHPDHEKLCLRPLCVARRSDLAHKYVVVEFFQERNSDFCKEFGRLVSVFRSSDRKQWMTIPESNRGSEWMKTLVVLECEPHSWVDFFDPVLAEALLKVHEPNTMKKDELFVEGLRMVAAVYKGREPEPSVPSIWQDLKDMIMPI